jgi:hypothetical protein
MSFSRIEVDKEVYKLPKPDNGHYGKAYVQLLLNTIPFLTLHSVVQDTEDVYECYLRPTFGEHDASMLHLTSDRTTNSTYTPIRFQFAVIDANEEILDASIVIPRSASTFASCNTIFDIDDKVFLFASRQYETSAEFEAIIEFTNDVTGKRYMGFTVNGATYIAPAFGDSSPSYCQLETTFPSCDYKQDFAASLVMYGMTQIPDSTKWDGTYSIGGKRIAKTSPGASASFCEKFSVLGKKFFCIDAYICIELT